ncbi:hypothetical protein C8Q80DRAFT_1208654 [Daedaleopsis nitida]|nr:hypothetical protein C8Q80DRAFT_1208654 [Daedaleopsis nitida]
MYPTPKSYRPHNLILVAKAKEICQFPDKGESRQIISGLKGIGLFSSAPVEIPDGNLFDTFCAQLDTLVAYAAGERDFDHALG